MYRRLHPHPSRDLASRIAGSCPRREDDADDESVERERLGENQNQNHTNEQLQGTDRHRTERATLDQPRVHAGIRGDRMEWGVGNGGRSRNALSPR